MVDNIISGGILAKLGRLFSTIAAPMPEFQGLLSSVRRDLPGTRKLLCADEIQTAEKFPTIDKFRIVL